MVNKRLRHSQKKKKKVVFGFLPFLFRIKTPNLMEWCLMLLHAQEGIPFAKDLANFC